MLVKDVMTREVVTLSPEDSLRTAVEKLSSRGISGAPVVENGKVVGTISERDILEAIDVFFPKVHLDTGNFFSAIISLLKQGSSFREVKKHLIEAEKVKVRDVMKRCAVTVEENATIMDAVRLMTRHGVNRLPVVSGGKLVGIITRADILKALGR